MPAGDPCSPPPFASPTGPRGLIKGPHFAQLTPLETNCVFWTFGLIISPSNTLDFSFPGFWAARLSFIFHSVQRKQTTQRNHLLSLLSLPFSHPVYNQGFNPCFPFYVFLLSVFTCISFLPQSRFSCLQWICWSIVELQEMISTCGQRRGSVNGAVFFAGSPRPPSVCGCDEKMMKRDSS